MVDFSQLLLNKINLIIENWLEAVRHDVPRIDLVARGMPFDKLRVSPGKLGIRVFQ